MTETSVQGIEIGAAGLLPDNAGLLRRGDAKLSILGLGGSAGAIAPLKGVLTSLNTRTERNFSCCERTNILRRVARRMKVRDLASSRVTFGRNGSRSTGS